jgi:hypothetical protein
MESRVSCPCCGAGDVMRGGGLCSEMPHPENRRVRHPKIAAIAVVVVLVLLVRDGAEMT